MGRSTGPLGEEAFLRHIYRYIVRQIKTTEWAVLWFETSPGEDPREAFALSEDPTPEQHLHDPAQQDSSAVPPSALQDEPDSNEAEGPKG